MSKTVAYGDFDLIKVKVEGKKVEATYYEKSRPNKEQRPKCIDIPHNDLLNAFNDNVGKEVFATSLGMLEGWDFAREHNRKNLETLEIARRKWAEEVTRFEVAEVEFVGDEETTGLRLKGKLDCESSKPKIESPLFVFDEASEEIKQRANDWAEKIKAEVWSYLFKDKMGQTKLDFEEPTMRVANG